MAGLPGADWLTELKLDGYRALTTRHRNDVEVLVMGEGLEWETIEYGAVAEGRKKALVILGHIPSEQAGMDDCARWLGTFVTEVPVEFVPTAEPFWPAK